jgi:hypothetical protein
MAPLLFVSKRLQTIAVAILLLAMFQLTLAAREPRGERAPQAPPGAVVIAINSGSR